MLEVAMSRTAHHIRSRRLDGDRHWEARPSGPWRAVRLTDLRYSEAEAKAALIEGRRSQPRMVHRHVDLYSFLGAYGRGKLAEDANLEERSERRRLRDRLYATVKRANSAPLTDFVDEDDLEIHPYRPRHGALWNAW
ncbi:hypothetical protein GCM10022226_37880 [Sphaerisporangium flaviroseum]|uniref:Integrase n=1 Tax=Sphaerisporangium flaviroseum TaxID=509199 RepID=A0ABP7IAK1_9ACTN